MDMLKLLKRSSNLAKTKVNSESVPSAGSLPKKQSAGDESGEGLHELSKGVKRKRGDGAHRRGEKKEPQSRLANVSEDSRGLGESSAGKNLHHNSNNENALAPEENVKRLLKAKKIGVSILTASTGSNADQTSFKPPKEAQRSGSKEGYRKLFPSPLSSFRQLRSEFGISRRLDENLRAQGFHEPTEVQTGSLPLLLGSDKQRGLEPDVDMTTQQHRSEIDLLTVAPTGSGKTVAFLLPTLQSLLDERQVTVRPAFGSHGEERQVRAIILAPTHELVEQIVNEGKKLAQGTGIRISALRKGVRLHEDLLKNPLEERSSSSDVTDVHVPKTETLVKSDVIVSTPPLLAYAILNEDTCSAAPLPSVRHLILDEADILLDKMFHEKTVSIWGACENPMLRTSLWSATINSSVESFAQRFILDRRKRSLEDSSMTSHYVLRLIVGLKDSSLPNISHRLVYAATERGKLLALRQLLNPASASSNGVSVLQPPFIVFTQTIPRAIALHSELLYDIPPEAGGTSRIAVLHSEQSETARSNVMKGVRNGDIWVLITTDLLSRGVDFKGMNGVVSYDIPSTSASYVHRAGRTGRQGREGAVAVTLYTKEDIPYVKNVVNVIAASEKAKAGGDTGASSAEQSSVREWLLDSLPDLSKKTKRSLKQNGIEYRKEHAGIDPRTAKKMRIGTKSGYDRRMENRLRGMTSARRKQSSRQIPKDGNPNDDWEGFD